MAVSHLYNRRSENTSSRGHGGTGVTDLTARVELRTGASITYCLTGDKHTEIEYIQNITMFVLSFKWQCNVLL